MKIIDPFSFSFIELYFHSDGTMTREIALEGARMIRDFYSPQG